MATIKLKYRPSATKATDGTLFFQIIHRRQVRQINTGARVSTAQWNAATESIIIPSEADPGETIRLSSIKQSLERCRKRLIDIISGFERKGIPFTSQDVVMAYNMHPAVDGLISFTQKLIEDLRKIGKKSAVKRYTSTLNCLLRYTDGSEVAWDELTSDFIIGFEEFMTRRGLCRNSTSFYMRNLRAILNRAAERDFNVPRNLFRRVYTGIDKTVKRAVSLDVIRMIRDIDLTGHPALDFARKVFMFAFYTRGMSFVDIAYVKKSDQHNGVITYSRRKTRQLLTVRIEPETRKVIESFGKNETSFLLPILKDGAKDMDQQYENAYFRINRNIQKVGKMLGLETKLTLYVARHAWASIAHSNNVALSTISKAMGHDSEKTTVIYLQSLDYASVDKANSDIIRMIDRKKAKR